MTPDTRGCEIDIRELVDRLDELVAQGWRVPLSDRVVVERTALLNLLDQMRIAIPQEIQRASALEQERDRVLALANSQAEEIVARAQERADRLLHEHAVRQAAEEEAAAILAEAEAQATYTCDQADAYAVGELRSLQNHLNRLQRVVANGLQRLEERHQARLQPQQTEPVTEQETEPQNGSGRPPESRQMRA